MIVQAYAVSDHRIFGALDVSAGGFKTTIQQLRPQRPWAPTPGEPRSRLPGTSGDTGLGPAPGVFHSHVKMNLNV